MSKIDITDINDVVEADGISQFDSCISEGYVLLAVGVHTDVLDAKGNTRLSTIFTMGKHTPNK